MSEQQLREYIVEHKPISVLEKGGLIREVPVGETVMLSESTAARLFNRVRATDTKEEEVDNTPKTKTAVSVIKEEDEGDETKGDLAYVPLAEYKLADAVALVEDEENVNVLAAWMEGESRKGVQQAIEKRFQELASSEE